MEYEIKPQGRLNTGLRELWAAREMCYFFAWRDIKVRYKQTVLGVAWVVLQPLAMMGIFTLLLGRYVSPGGNVSYPVFAFTGLCLWNLFSSGFTSAGNSMVMNAAIIKKIYFPRLIIPVSTILVSLLDFVCTLPFIFILVAIRHETIHWNFLPLMIPAVLLTLIATNGFGILISALNVKYRDFRYVIPFAAQFLLFVTPVVYPASFFHHEWVRTLVAFNPMSGAVELFRSFLTGELPVSNHLVISCTSGILLLVTGLLYFRSTERTFADIA